MGSGKTTVGRALGAALGWPFVDLDAEVEALALSRARRPAYGEADLRVDVGAQETAEEVAARVAVWLQQAGSLSGGPVGAGGTSPGGAGKG